jgi:predicted kinase
LIIIVCGLPGVGKTSLANELAPLIRAVVLSTDKIRKELISKPTYRIQERKLIYDIMLLLARYLHDAGINCILDATFNTENSRRELKKRLNLISSPQINIVECTCPEHIAISRLRSRKNDYSDADISIYKRMRSIYQPIKEKHIVVDTSQQSTYMNAREIANQLLKNETKN